MDRKINYPEIMNNNPLKTIFELQGKLLEHYILIEGMPNYPINISEKSGQKLMREFIRRGIEELSEAHDIYQQIYKGASITREQVKDWVLSFNEELSDALHFFIEAFMYSNIFGEDIDNYYYELFRDSGMDGNRKQPLQKAVEYARFQLNGQGYDLSNKGFKTIDIGAEEAFYRTCAGKCININMLYQQSQLMWDVVHNFMKATNLLKNNDWKQTEVETDVDAFQRQMMLGWLALMNLLVYSGLNSEGIYLMYCHKNIINQKRIEEKR